MIRTIPTILEAIRHCHDYGYYDDKSILEAMCI